MQVVVEGNTLVTINGRLTMVAFGMGNDTKQPVKTEPVKHVHACEVKRMAPSYCGCWMVEVCECGYDNWIPCNDKQREFFHQTHVILSTEEYLKKMIELK